jgi:ABC-type branched-subunit amino acid transport system substrate-binding protein
MKSIHLLVLIIILSSYSCVSKPVIPSVPVKLEPDESLFMEAEDLYGKKSYQQAINIYQEYLERFADKKMAPAALMKIGLIKDLLKDYPGSRSSYSSLIKSYPQSSFNSDAMLGILRTYYKEGKYQEALKYGSQILKKIVSREHILNIYIMFADICVAQGNPKDAVYYYTMACGKADDLTRKSIIAKLKESLKHLQYTDAVTVFELINDNYLKGLVLYLLGTGKIEEEYYDDAQKILLEFIKQFPDHEKAAMATGQLSKLESLSIYDHKTIGCLLPLSGPYKAYGKRALRGIELALNKFIARNKHRNEKHDTNKLIKIIIKDIGTTHDEAASAVRELSQEGVAAIIGPIFSTEAAAAEAQNSGIPIITITQKDNITETGDFVFRNFFTPRMQVKALISFAVEELGVDRFAILYPEDKYGTTFMNLFWDEVLACGGILTGLESYPVNQSDLDAPIKKLVGLYYDIPEDLFKKNVLDDTKKEKSEDILIKYDNILDEDAEALQIETEEDETEKEPEPIIDFDVLFIPDGPTRAGLIMPQLAYHDIENVYIFGTNLWHSNRLIEMARKYVQNAVMPDIFFTGSSSEAVQDFVKNFKDVFKEDPGFIEAITYDTAMILFNIISRDDISFRSTIKHELTRTTGFDCITGHTIFNKTGDAEKKLYLLNIKGKKFIEIKQ